MCVLDVRACSSFSTHILIRHHGNCIQPVTITIIHHDLGLKLISLACVSFREKKPMSGSHDQKKQVAPAAAAAGGGGRGYEGKTKSKTKTKQGQDGAERKKSGGEDKDDKKGKSDREGEGSGGGEVFNTIRGPQGLADYLATRKNEDMGQDEIMDLLPRADEAATRHLWDLWRRARGLEVIFLFPHISLSACLPPFIFFTVMQNVCMCSCFPRKTRPVHIAHSVAACPALVTVRWMIR